MKTNEYSKRIEQLEKQIVELRDMLVTDGEDMVEDVADTASGYKEWLGEKAAEAFGSMKDSAKSGIKRARRMTRHADEYAHDHPWQVAAGGVAAGILLGILLNRRRD